MKWINGFGANEKLKDELRAQLYELKALFNSLNISLQAMPETLEYKGIEMLVQSIYRPMNYSVQQTEKECARLASLARASYDMAMEAVINGDAKAIERVYENEKIVDKLTHGITKYIVKINGLDIIDYDRKVMGAMYNAIQDLERIGDRSENMCEAAQKMINGEVVLTEDAMKELRILCETVQQILEDSFYMFTHQSKDPELTEAVLQAEDQIDEYCELFRQHHIERLSKGICSAEAGTVFIELITNLERVGDHAVTVAFCIPYKHGAPRPALNAAN